jgi:hypothetical protein
MRRRTLLATLTAGAVGLAGCSLPSSESSTTTTAGTTEADPSATTSQPSATETVTSGTPAADSEAAELLAFDAAIGETTRQRCRRALTRTMAMTGVTLSEPIRITQVTPRLRQGTDLPAPHGIVFLNAPDVVGRPPQDVTVPGSLGYYDAGDRTLSLADPADVPDTIFGGTDDAPTVSFADYPNEPFLAHELAHAVQNHATTVADLPDGTDGESARRGVTEGTADYVQGRYRQACASGEYDPCRARDSFPGTPDVPLWLVPRRLPYVNGTAFAHAAVQRGGWDLLWEQHRSPPETAQAVMFPDMHFEDAVTVESLDPHPEVDGNWNRLRDGRQGVGPLYLKLRAHGIAAGTDESASVPSSLTAQTGLEYVFRHDLLREWRGDYRTTYVKGSGRAVIHWRTRWASEAAARRVTDGVSDDYAASERVDDGTWEVGQGIVTVERDGRTVTFGRAPSMAAKGTVLDAA